MAPERPGLAPCRGAHRYVVVGPRGDVEGQPVVRLSGELDMATSAGVEQTLTTMAGPAVVVVDLQGVSFIDSSGLSTLLRAKREIERRGSQLVLRNPHPNVLRVLQLTGLDRMLLEVAVR